MVKEQFPDDRNGGDKPAIESGSIRHQPSGSEYMVIGADIEPVNLLGAHVLAREKWDAANPARFRPQAPEASEDERLPAGASEYEGSALSRLPHRVVNGQVFVSIPIRPQVSRQIIESAETE